MHLDQTAERIAPGSPVVATLTRYPVKGLGGELLPAAPITSRGLPWDRVLGLANARREVRPFGHWTTYDAFHALSTRPDLGAFRARVRPHREPEMPGVVIAIEDVHGTVIRVPLAADGSLAESQADVLAPMVQQWFGTASAAASLVASGVHLWDVAEAQVSIINLASVRDLASAVGVDIQPERFRANVCVEGWEPWEEFDLIGRVLRIGDVELEVMEPIERCSATSVAPGRTKVDLVVPSLLQGYLGHNFCGVYARVRHPGVAHVGDPVSRAEAATPPPEQQPSKAPRFATIAHNASPTATVRSVRLVDASGGLSAAVPGQYVRLHRRDDQPSGWRDYTLSDTVDSRITVKLEPDGKVSPWVHHLRPGDRVLTSGPYGDEVALDQGRPPLLLISGGIGITPTLAIAAKLFGDDRARRDLRILHVEREGVPAHWSDVQKAAARHPNVEASLFLTGSSGNIPPGAKRGRPTSADVIDALPTDRDVEVRLCGSPAFTAAFESLLIQLGVDTARISYDRFYSPAPPLVRPRRPPVDGPFSVQLFDEDRATWRPDSGTLLDLVEQSGLDVGAECRSGVCGSCARTVSGEVFLVREPMAPTRPGDVLLCCAVPTTDVSISGTVRRPGGASAGMTDS